MADEGYYISIMERAQDRWGELESEEQERERERKKKEDPRKKMMDDIIRALAPCTDPDVSNDIKLKIGMMVRAEQTIPHDNEPPMAIVVVEKSPMMGVNKIQVPMTELGVGEMIFVSKESRLGEELLRKAILDGGIGELTFFTESGRYSRTQVTWNVTALYEPQEAKEIILNHLEEVAV